MIGYPGRMRHQQVTGFFCSSSLDSKKSEMQTETTHVDTVVAPFRTGVRIPPPPPSFPVLKHLKRRYFSACALPTLRVCAGKDAVRVGSLREEALPKNPDRKDFAEDLVRVCKESAMTDPNAMGHEKRRLTHNITELKKSER